MLSINDRASEVVEYLYAKVQGPDRLSHLDLLDLKNEVCRKVLIKRPKYAQELDNLELLLGKRTGSRTPLGFQFFLNYPSQLLTPCEFNDLEFLHGILTRYGYSAISYESSKVQNFLLGFKTEDEAVDIVNFIYTDQRLSAQDFVNPYYKGTEQN